MSQFPPQTSTGLTRSEGYNHQVATSKIPQSGGSVFWARLSRDINSGKALLLRSDLGWNVIDKPGDARNSTFDPGDPSRIDFEGDSNGFDWDPFMGVNPLKVASKLP
jgi:hypothetical protein